MKVGKAREDQVYLTGEKGRRSHLVEHHQRFVTLEKSLELQGKYYCKIYLELNSLTQAEETKVSFDLSIQNILDSMATTMLEKGGKLLRHASRPHASAMRYLITFTSLALKGLLVVCDFPDINHLRVAEYALRSKFWIPGGESSLKTFLHFPPSSYKLFLLGPQHLSANCLAVNLPKRKGARDSRMLSRISSHHKESFQF